MSKKPFTFIKITDMLLYYLLKLTKREIKMNSSSAINGYKGPVDISDVFKENQINAPVSTDKIETLSNVFQNVKSYREYLETEVQKIEGEIQHIIKMKSDEQAKTSRLQKLITFFGEICHHKFPFISVAQRLAAESGQTVEAILDQMDDEKQAKALALKLTPQELEACSILNTTFGEACLCVANP